MRLAARCYNLADAPTLQQAVIESREYLLPFLFWTASAPEFLHVHVDSLRARRLSGSGTSTELTPMQFTKEAGVRDS